MDKFLQKLRRKFKNTDKESKTKEESSENSSQEDCSATKNKKRSPFRSFRNYVSSKFSTKYEINNSNKKEIQIISYEPVYQEVTTTERQPQIQLNRGYSLLADKKLLRSLGRVLDARQKTVSLEDTKGRLELLEIIEKTFARQLDIFEELLRMIDKSSADDIMENTDQKIESFDNFINDFLQDMITQTLSNSVEGVSVPDRASNNNNDEISNEPGDTLKLKTRPEVLCECQEITERGAAVPSVVPLSNNDQS